MAGNYEAVQAKAIAAKGNDVSVITIRESSARNIFCWKKIGHRQVDGVNVYEAIVPSIQIPFIRRVNKHFRKLSYRFAFEKFAKEQGMPDMVHAHIVFVANFVTFVKKKYKLPFVITEHWSKAFVPDDHKLIKMSVAYQIADQVICVSEALADSLKKSFHVEGIVINNMVSNQFFKTAKIPPKDRIFRFISCGAFRKDRYKGFDILIDAFARACFPKDVHLDIIGDGKDRTFIESKIAEYRLSNQVRLLGVKTSEEVSELLCMSDCFVLSSRLETFAIVVIEAMAKGLPIIATRCGGPETFLQPEHGLLIDKENVEQLADAMKYMIEHHGDYDSCQIRKYCYDHFSQDVIADQIIDVYKQVLARR